MHPFTHLFTSWSIADSFDLDSRDRALVAWAGVIPDADGLTLLGDLAARIAGHPTYFYADYHHMLFHGLPAAVLLTAAGGLLAHKKWKTVVLVLLVFHLHLLCDLLGSRGQDPLDVWPIAYLGPLSDRLTLYWWKQWPLHAWPNVVLSLLLMALIGWRACRRGYSVLSLISRKADNAFVGALMARFKCAYPAS